MTVLIIGGGLGGLCLANGLRRAGHPVDVYERDPGAATRAQGYRLHIDGRGATALHACLPPALYEAFLATSGRPGRQVTIVSKNLRQLKVFTTPPGPPGDSPAAVNTSVDRNTLREILLAGLDGTVRFDKTFTGYDVLGTGVRAHFDDGSHADGDLLVGADGTGSVVRRQLLPDAVVDDTGERCIYGRTMLTPEAEALLPDRLRDGFMAVVGFGGLGLALGLVDFREPPAVAGARLGIDLTARPNYLMWALSGRFDTDVMDRSPTDLHQLALRLVDRWDARLPGLIALADPQDCFPVRVSVSRPVPPWPTGPVTLLGDAIHAMSPARGSGANIALKDAGVLTAALTGGQPWPDAVAAYENDMRDYGFAAVRDSLAVARTGNGFGARLLRAVHRRR